MQTNYGLLNYSYRQGFFFVKKNKPYTFAYWNHKKTYEVLLALKNINYENNYIHEIKLINKTLISKYQFLESHKTIKIEKELLHLIANKLNEFHKLNLSKVSLKWKYYSFYLNLIKKIKNPFIDWSQYNYLAKKTKIFESRDFVFCHNDLHDKNILINEKHVIFVDLDFCCFNYRLFDICSFVIENNLDEDHTTTWLNYFALSDTEKNDYHLMCKYLYLIWSAWANYCFENETEENIKNIFLEIYRNYIFKLNR